MSDLIQFDRFSADLLARELHDGSCVIELRPRSFEVLRRLLATPGTVVTKDELFEAAWPGQVVTDDSLARCVSDIRLALGDSAQRIVKTVPRRGYLLAVPVTSLEPSPSIAPSPRTPPARAFKVSRRAALLGCVGALTGLGGLVWGWPRRPGSIELPTVVVLPFDTPEPDPLPRYFADGVTEDISVRLARFRELLIIARDSAFAFRDNRPSPAVVATALGVRYLVLGSIRRNGHRLRVTAQLIDAHTGIQRWADAYDRSMADLNSVQDELAQHIASTLLAHIAQTEMQRARQMPPGSVAAYDRYLEGKHLLAQVDAAGRTEYGDRVYAARTVLQAAFEADTRYAPALTALSDSYHRAWIVPSTHPATRGDYQSAAASDIAFRLAQDAVALDPWYADAHAQLAWVLHWRYRREEALEEFSRAVELNPNLADGRFGLLLAHAGRPAAALSFMQRVARLDPFHRPIYLSYIANAHFLAGQYEQSVIAGRIAAARMPAVIQCHVWLAAACVCTDRADEAVAAATEVQRLLPNFTIGRFLTMVRLAREDDVRRLNAALSAAGLPA